MERKQSMPPDMPTLADQFRAYLAEQPPERRAAWCSSNCADSRCISRLAARGVTTLAELVEALPNLPPKLKNFGISWLGRFKQYSKPPQVEAVLLRLMKNDPACRHTCAWVLGWTEGRRSLREFLKIGTAQLAAESPDLSWLDAVIDGLKYSDKPQAVEILVTIYERHDLPGWLRGDAGDALGCKSQLQDRRTRIFRRVWTTALQGLDHDDIEVQFWSMYVIMQLATRYNGSDCNSNRCLQPALPRLREIALNDHRLAPGYWWTMCEEARDTIHLIETGQTLIPDAAERCQGNTERGPMCFRY